MQSLFEAPAFLEMLKSIETDAVTEEARDSIKLFIEELHSIFDRARPLRSLLQASSSMELKAAVDRLPRPDICFNPEQIRYAILQKQNLIVDAPTADSVLLYLRRFGDSESTADLLRTAKIRDLIIDVLAPKISPGDSVENIAATICFIVQNKRAAEQTVIRDLRINVLAPKISVGEPVYHFDRPIWLTNVVRYENKLANELYSNRKLFAAILDCFHRATTTGSAEAFASSISAICKNYPGANKNLNDLPVVEAYSAITPYATTELAVWSISNSIETILDDNQPAQKLFGTPAFLEDLKLMEKSAISDWSKSSCKIVVDVLQPIAAERLSNEQF